MAERAGSPEYFGRLYQGIRTELSRRQNRIVGFIDTALPIETDQDPYLLAVNQWRHFASNILGETVNSLGSHQSVLKLYGDAAFDATNENAEAMQIALVMHPFNLMPQAMAMAGRLADLPLAIALIRGSRDLGDFAGTEDSIIADQRHWGATDEDILRAQELAKNLRTTLNEDTSSQ